MARGFERTSGPARAISTVLRPIEGAASHPWVALATAAGLTYLGAYLIALAGRPFGAFGAQLLSDFGELPLQILGIAVAAAVVLHERRGRRRVGWALVMVALAADMTGNAIYAAYDLAGQQPFPSIADAFYLTFYPLMFLGMLILPTAKTSGHFDWRVGSNVAIVLLGGGITLIHFVLLPVLDQLPEDTLSTVISLAYPAGDLALLAALGTIATRRPYARDRGALAWFIVAGASWFFADLLFAIESTNGAFVPGSPSDLVWVVGDVAFLLAGRAQMAGLPAIDAGEPTPALSIGRIGPYAMLGLGLATLVVASIQPRGEMVVLVILAVTLTVLVVARQLIDEYQRREAEAALLAEQTAAAERAARLARHDSLTGLSNRASLREVLAAEIEASRLTGRPVTLVFIDLDFFKLVNDTYGHAAGDRILVEVARRLESSVRSGDTVARLGGDEFALILPATPAEVAVDVAARARLQLERPFAIDGAEVTISGAFGLATYPDGGATKDDALMHQADTAMYQAKRAHLGPTVYETGFEGTNDGASLLTDLRSAIAGDGLFLEYQPIRRRSTGRIAAVEALVRWRHPRRGVLRPADFLPLAVQAGLVRGLDRVVLGEACAQAARWRRTGLDVTISVNVSRDSLQDTAFPGHVRAAMQAHGLSGNAIVLEASEEGLVDDPDQVGAFVAAMRLLGVRLAIDDFGRGVSSLARLRELRADYLKIDGSFVTQALRDEDSGVIVEAVVPLAHRLGMEVVAEGVEDEATLHYLDGLGVDFAQGFAIGRPMDARSIARRLRTDGDGGDRASVVNRALMKGASRGAALQLEPGA